MLTAWVPVLAFSSGVIPSVAGFWFLRKKTKADTVSALATAANVLAGGATEMVTANIDRITDLERRVTMAEQAAALAHQSALLAREAEMRCLHRLEDMQAQLNEMRLQLANPPVTTTVTTAITTQEMPTHE